MSPRRRTTYLILIGVGGVALLVEAFVLGEDATPQTAPDGGSSGSVVLAVSAAVAEVGGPLPVPELPFPVLKAKETPELTRDPFRPPGSPDNAMGGEAEAKKGSQVTSHLFGELHRLDGVMLQQSLKIAIVDGTSVRIGQAIDGCTLTAVSENDVRFSCDDGEVTLRVGASNTRDPG